MAALVACGHSGSTPTNIPDKNPANDAFPTNGPPLLTPGERMQYRVALKGLELATYTITVGDITELDGKKVITIVGNAKLSGIAAWFSQKIDDKFTSWIDITTGRSLRFQADEYGTGTSDIEHAIVDFTKRTPTSVPVTFHLNDQPEQPEPQALSRETFDLNEFLVALRAWEGTAGTKQPLDIFRSRFLWRAEVTIKGKTKLDTEMGDLPALRFDAHLFKLDKKGGKFPDTDERDFSLWVSDDAGRVPLKIVAKTDYGDVEIKIVDYQAGNGEPLRKSEAATTAAN
jgi:hypothetical protein